MPKRMYRLLFALLLLTAPLRADSVLLLPALNAAEAEKWRAIGRFGAGPAFCTGALIAPDVVLTAGHCAMHGKPPADPPLLFLSDPNAEDTPARVVDRKHHPAFDQNRRTPQFDLGLLFLDRDLEIEPIALAPLPQEPVSEVALIGYHRLSPSRPAGRADCPVLSQTRQLLFLGCRVISGASGSPVMIRTPTGEWQIVGVIVAQSGPNAIAVTLAPWVTETREAHLRK